MQELSRVRMTSEERRRLERNVKEKAYIRGEEYDIDPQIFPYTWGDGGTVALIYPINLRPNYYIVAIDSNSPDIKSDEWYSFMDSIYIELEDYFGKCNCDDEVSEGIVDWPTACFCIGSHWDVIKEGE